MITTHNQGVGCVSFFCTDSRSMGGAALMTLLGNFDSMSGQEENEPFIWNKRSKRSMRGKDQRSHQEGNGSRTASYAVRTRPIPPFSPCSLVRTKFPNRVIDDASPQAIRPAQERPTGVITAAPPVFPSSSLQKNETHPKKRASEIVARPDPPCGGQAVLASRLQICSDPPCGGQAHLFVSTLQKAYTHPTQKN